MQAVFVPQIATDREGIHYVVQSAFIGYIFSYLPGGIQVSMCYFQEKG